MAAVVGTQDVQDHADMAAGRRDNARDRLWDHTDLCTKLGNSGRQVSLIEMQAGETAGVIKHILTGNDLCPACMLWRCQRSSEDSHWVGDIHACQHSVCLLVMLHGQGGQTQFTCLYLSASY